MLPRNLILIGYRGTGKTTVGRLLANRLDWAFVDQDAVVEESAGQSIREIFATQGEQAFRDLESTVLAKLCQRDRQVLATGGGAILRLENRVLLKHAGFVVWLKADVDTILARLQADPLTTATRPPLTRQDARDEVVQLLGIRTPLYHEAADLEIDAARLHPEDVADSIIAHVHD
jgi:shikimate kinase